MKDINEMNDHELLMELIAEKRRNDKIRTVSYAVMTALFFLVGAVLVFYIPKINKLIADCELMIGQINEISGKVKDLTDAVDIDPELIRKLNQSIQEIMDMFSFFNS